MAQKPPPESTQGKAEGGGEPRAAGTGSLTPIERFRTLARGILNVSRDRLREEEARDKERRDKDRRR